MRYDIKAGLQIKILEWLRDERVPDYDGLMEYTDLALVMTNAAAAVWDAATDQAIRNLHGANTTDQARESRAGGNA